MAATWTIKFEDGREAVSGVATFEDCLDVVQGVFDHREIDWRKPNDRDSSASWEVVNEKTGRIVAKMYFDWN